MYIQVILNEFHCCLQRCIDLQVYHNKTIVSSYNERIDALQNTPISTTGVLHGLLKSSHAQPKYIITIKLTLYSARLRKGLRTLCS